METLSSVACEARPIEETRKVLKMKSFSVCETFMMPLENNVANEKSAFSCKLDFGDSTWTFEAVYREVSESEKWMFSVRAALSTCARFNKRALIKMNVLDGQMSSADWSDLDLDRYKVKIMEKTYFEGEKSQWFAINRDISRHSLKVQLIIEMTLFDEPFFQSTDSKKFEPMSLKADLQSGIDQRIATDVRLVTADGRFDAHKSILALRSHYFFTMFSSGLEESHSGQVLLGDISSKVFKDVLRYIYTDATDAIDQKQVLDLLQASDRFQIEGLRRKCVEYLTEHLDNDNVIHAIEYAATRKEEHLRQKSLDHFMDNSDVLVVRPDYVDAFKKLPLCIKELVDSLIANKKKKTNK